MNNRKVVRKTAAKKTTTAANGTKKKIEPTMPKTVEVKIEVTIWVDAPLNDERTIEEFRADIHETLKDPNGGVRAKRVTDSGGYYLVDGKVCLPGDYDVEKRTFKKGSHPPLWAMGPDERKIMERIEQQKDRPALAKQPENLRTASETDALHAKEKRISKTKAALDDLHENSEWGQRKKLEREQAEKEAAERASASGDEDEIIEDEFDDGEEEPWEEEDDPEADFEWDEDDPFDEETADEAIEEQTSTVLARLRSGENGGTKVVKKPVRKVVRRK